MKSATIVHFCAIPSVFVKKLRRRNKKKGFHQFGKIPLIKNTILFSQKEAFLAL